MIASAYTKAAKRQDRIVRRLRGYVEHAKDASRRAKFDYMRQRAIGRVQAYQIAIRLIEQIV